MACRGTAVVLVLSALMYNACGSQSDTYEYESKPKRGLEASLAYGYPGVAVPAAGSLVPARGYFFPGPHTAPQLPLQQPLAASHPGHYAAPPSAPGAPFALYPAPHVSYAAPPVPRYVRRAVHKPQYLVLRPRHRFMVANGE
ncbi:uncharacterized protein LOC124774760 [Schistocerca piceifrons]|uniref:uncharacterized protein LOC124774760 n=1 Tax=Schistocerca piceifrons TaxID=274613 RepID=UPI001F5F886A|nr:uncharacterized protein LOC124774760 [Schistocerca piceifrons]